jgi:dCMP deaminase
MGSGRVRPDWDTTWMSIAAEMGARSRCDRRQVGAVIVGPNNRIVATGYNGPPAGLHLEPGSTCSTWCSRARSSSLSSDYSDCLTVHAEANALMYADRRLYEGGTLYVTSSVCWSCAKLVANSGISTVVMNLDIAEDAHRNPDKSILFMEECGLQVIVL